MRKYLACAAVSAHIPAQAGFDTTVVLINQGHELLLIVYGLKEAFDCFRVGLERKDEGLDGIIILIRMAACGGWGH